MVQIRYHSRMMEFQNALTRCQPVDFRKYVDIFSLEGNRLQTQRKQVYARGEELSSEFDKLITRIQQKANLSVDNIAKRCKVSRKQLSAWRTGRSAIPIRVLRQITSELGEKASSIVRFIDQLSGSKGAKILIPRTITPTLVEILGRFCGDGSCGIYGNETYKFSLKESASFVTLHSQDMARIFGIQGKVKHYPRVSENVIHSKPLVLLFQRIFGYRAGFHKSLHVKPPRFLEDLNWRTRSRFTTGLIDTEGSFYKDRSTRTITFEIKMRNSSLIREVGMAFKELGIHYNYYSRPKGNPTTFRIRSYGRESLRLLKDAFEPKNQRHLSQLTSFGL